MKRKWWLIGGAVVSALLLSLCFFGVRLRIAPRWMLSRALGSALTQLETRFEESPVHLVAEALDPEGCQQASVQLETELEHLGVVRYDMSVQTQLAPCRIRAEGTVVNGGKALDLVLYMDRDFTALSSNSLVDGTFYGITYDSFSQDIRSRELLAMLIGEETMNQWETSVSKLEAAMAVDLSMPQLSAEDVRTALYGVLALKPQVGTQEMMLSGQKEKVHTVSFRATGQEIAAAAASYQENMTPELRALVGELEADADSAVNAVFFLHKGKLIKITGNLELSEASTRITLDLGLSPATEPLTLELETAAGEDLDRISLVLENVSDGDSFEERILLTRTQNAVQQKLTLDYHWDLSSGDMRLNAQHNSRKAEVRLNLAGEGEKLTITTQDASPLINLFLEEPWESPAICTLQVSPGTDIQVPEYRNLDLWSIEDLFALLSGFGGLLGLQLP